MQQYHPQGKRTTRAFDWHTTNTNHDERQLVDIDQQHDEGVILHAKLRSVAQCSVGATELARLDREEELAMKELDRMKKKLLHQRQQQFATRPQQPTTPQQHPLSIPMPTRARAMLR